jgi:large subunit ribosomal protein L20
MVRIKRGNIAANRRKKYLILAKGYRGLNSRSSTLAKEQVKQSLNFAYISRRLKKRTFRRFWIYRINAALKIKYNNYSTFMGTIRKLNIFLNRKILAHLAFQDLPIFNLIERFSKIN